MPKGSRAIPPTAALFVPKTKNLGVLARAVNGCHGCGLYRNATQGVFGEGPADASIVLVGEQPGDQEDRAGKPFVGPSGGVLDDALEEAGIPRDEVYITNAVKHFSWQPVGKRRLHKRPLNSEIHACKPWLQAELHVIRPLILVCLGSVAAQSIFGKIVRVGELRGRFVQTLWSQNTFVTVHPSSILRAVDDEARRAEYRHFVADLKMVKIRLRIRQRKAV